MWSQFLLENTHFAINLFASLVFFAVFWLYFDAWKGKKTVKEGIRIIGFLLLSISFLLKASFLESSIIQASILLNSHASFVYLVLRNLGYVLVITSGILDKMQAKPVNAVFMLPVAVLQISILQIAPPILALFVGALYLIKAMVGLEAHLKPVAVSFLFLTLSEILSLGSLLRGSQDITIFNAVAPFGPVWVAEHVFLFIACVLLARWVFGYLLKQFEPQLFMILSSLILIIFLVTTVTFTGLLLKNIQDETLKQLNSDVAVLQYSLDGKKSEVISDAQVVSQNQSVIDAVKNSDKEQLATLATQFLLSKKETTLVIVNSDGQVIARGEDREKIGDSLSADRLITRSLNGDLAGTVVSSDGVLSPQISIRGASPIKDGQTVIGAVMLGASIDNAFVTGIKSATGLEASVYGDNVLSATTLLSLDKKSPLIGIKEENGEIKDTVLAKSSSFAGSVNIGNTLYFASYLPLLDVDKNPVGMLFVGRPQISVLQAAGKSIELTFIATVALLVISIIPSYLVARYIANQLK